MLARCRSRHGARRSASSGWPAWAAQPDAVAPNWRSRSVRSAPAARSRSTSAVSSRQAGLVQGGGALAEGVDVGAALEQERDRGGVALGGRAGDQARRRRVGDGGVGGHVGGLDALRRVRAPALALRPRAARRATVGVAFEQGDLQRRAALEDRVAGALAVGVDAGRRAAASTRRGKPSSAAHIRQSSAVSRGVGCAGASRACHGPPSPRAVAELEQQLEPGVVLGPVQVVVACASLGSAPASSRSAGERERVAVRRRVALAAPEGARERGERATAGRPTGSPRSGRRRRRAAARATLERAVAAATRE